MRLTAPSSVATDAGPDAPPKPGPAVIEIASLTKRYGKRRGIEDVTFDVRRGEIFGFLGPNGAGKTTTLRVLLDLLRPDAGRARVFGLDAREGRDEIHARTGYLPGEIGLFEHLKVREQLEDLADLRGGVPPGRIRHYAQTFDLDLEKPLRALSRGNKQKVGLVQALMHEPELLILDEPTSGLDPLVQQRFYAALRTARAQGRTVFLSSHNLTEVEHLCDRVAIIREGRLLTVSTVAEIKGKAVRTVTVKLKRPGADSALRDVPGVTEVTDVPGGIRFGLRGELGPALERLQPFGIHDVATQEPTLEDVFLAYYAAEAA